MSVRIEIFGDNAEQAIEEFRALQTGAATPVAAATMSASAIVMGMPLQDLKALAIARFAAEGFVVSFSDSAPPPKEEPLPVATVEAPPIKRRGGRPPKVPPAAAKASLKARSNGGHHTPAIVEAAPVVLSEPGEDVVLGDPDADRVYVLETLNGIYKDPAQKAKVTEFTSKVARSHGGERISSLPADQFPAIRRDMESEFGAL